MQIIICGGHYVSIFCCITQCYIHRHDHPDVHPSNISKLVTDLSLTAQTYEEIDLNHDYESIGFQDRPTEDDTAVHGGDFAYSGCAAYGVHYLGDHGAVNGKNVNMDKKGTDEQVVSSEHKGESYVDVSGGGYM